MADREEEQKAGTDDAVAAREVKASSRSSDLPSPLAALVDWATLRRFARTRRGRLERLLVAVTGLLSLALVTALIVGQAVPEPDLTQPSPTPTASGRGEPALAQELADQAEQISASDRFGALRLLLGAHILDPNTPQRRVALVEALLAPDSPGQVVPERVVRVRLDVRAPVTFAVASADATVLVTSGANWTGIWQTWILGQVPPWGARPAYQWDAPVTAAAGGGPASASTTLITVGGTVLAWDTSDLPARPYAEVGERADVAAVSTDGLMTVTVDSTTATLWEDVQPLAAREPRAAATLTYHQPPTVLAFGPGSNTLAAGHPDGAVTVHDIGYPQRATTRRDLTGGGATIDAVALSSSRSRALAVDVHGRVTVWDLTTDRSEPAGTTDGAGDGPHNAWVNSTGEFALIAPATGPVSVWSLTDPAPRLVTTMPATGGTTVPAMITADGQMALTINAASELTFWSLANLVAVLDDPIQRACEVVKPTHEQWRAMVPNPAFPNPCLPPPPPDLDATRPPGTGGDDGLNITPRQAPTKANRRQRGNRRRRQSRTRTSHVRTRRAPQR